MADRQFNRYQANGLKHVQVSFNFAPNGGSSPTGSGITGEGCASWVKSITRTGAGQWTITLNDAYSALVSARADLQMNANTDLNLQWGAIDVKTNKTLVLNALAAGVGTDIAANANNNIFVTLVLRNGVA